MRALLNQELEDWNENAEFYLEDFESPFQHLLLQEKIAAYSLNEEGKTVLDVGCGVGHFAHSLQKLGKDVIGLDFSPGMLKLAKKEFPGVDFVRASASCLPFKDAAFDVIVANGVLHHLKVQGSLHASALEFQRTLKGHGTLCFFDRNGSLLSSLLFSLFSALKRVLYACKGTFPGSASRNEVPFGNGDLQLILKSGFALEKKKNLSSVPFFFLVVATNTIQYLVGQRFASKLREILAPFARWVEHTVQSKWFTVEQSAKLRKMIPVSSDGSQDVEEGK